MIETLARYVAMPVIGVVLIGVAAAALGGLCAWLLLPSRKQFRKLESELAELTQTHARYKGDVLEHFHKTSDLFGQLTESYKAVYVHLAHGAQTLCSDHPTLEGSVFAGAKLLSEPAFDVGDREAASADAAEQASTISDANETSEIASSAPRASDAGPASTAAAHAGTAAADDGAGDEAAPEANDGESVAADPRREWRMEASSGRSERAADDDDGDADEDDLGRVTDSDAEDSDREVLAARGH